MLQSRDFPHALIYLIFSSAYGVKPVIGEMKAHAMFGPSVTPAASRADPKGHPQPQVSDSRGKGRVAGFSRDL